MLSHFSYLMEFFVVFHLSINVVSDVALKIA